MKKTYEIDPKTPWVHGPEGYITRPKLTQQYEKNEDIGADSPPEVMIARALAYRASELTRYKEEFDDESFLSYANDIVSRIPGYISDMIDDEKDIEIEEREWTHLSPADQRFKALEVFLGRIDDGGWDDDAIMEKARAADVSVDKDNEQRDQGHWGQEALSESRLARLAGLDEK